MNKNIYPSHFEKLEHIAWQILSFWALDKNNQMTLMGTTDNCWFLREKAAQNRGANYLFGLGICWHDYSGSLYDMYGFDIPKECMELDSFLNEKLNDRYDLFWSLASIKTHPDWRTLRELANKALCSLGLYLNPPTKPLKIERLIEVECYFLSKSENDKLLKKSNPYS